MQDFFTPPKPGKKKAKHYYGDTVRQLFLAGGIIILVAMPFYNNIIPADPILVTVLVVILALAAAITTIEKVWIMLINSIISAMFVVMFETYSVIYYVNDGTVLLLIRQAIALIFLFALYYSVKTLRAMFLHQIDPHT